MLALLAFGCVFFGVGWWADLITATDRTAYVTEGDGADRQLSKDYPRFNAPVYSLDTFVPLVDLRHAKHFLPSANRHAKWERWPGCLNGISGRPLRVYMWVHIAAGWTLTTLLVVGLTGLVRK